jgi:4-hydroxy-tetrahydrodipicolinate synthase
MTVDPVGSLDNASDSKSRRPPRAAPDAGVLVPLVTPFRNGEVDWASLAKAATWFAGTGVDGLWLNGTTSEFHALQADEMVEAVRVVAEAVRDTGCPVIAHVGAPATRLAVELAARSTQAGADAVAAVPPYYLPYADEELLAYFRAIKAATIAPLYAYNIPALTKAAVSPEAVLTLAADGTISGVKDTQWSVSEVAALTGKTRQRKLRAPVFTGDATKLSEAIAAGAAGTVTAISNVLPRHCLRLIAAAGASHQDTRHQEEAAARQRDLTEAVGYTALPTRPPGTPRMGAVKYLLAELGVIDDPEVAAPFSPLTPAERAELTATALPLVRRLEDEATS